MKIVYYTKRDKAMYLKLKNCTHILHSGEMLDIEDDVQSNIIQISTQKTDEVNVWGTVKLLAIRMIVNVFNVIIMNFSKEWLDNLDPFILSATHKVEQEIITLRYIPARFSKSPIAVKKPQLIINNELVDAKIEPDINAVKVSFNKYIFDLVSVWIYCALLITVIFLCSGKFLELIIVFAFILGGITLPVIFKIIKTYDKEQRVLEFIQAGKAL